MHFLQKKSVVYTARVLTILVTISIVAGMLLSADVSRSEVVVYSLSWVAVMVVLFLALLGLIHYEDARYTKQHPPTTKGE